MHDPIEEIILTEEFIKFVNDKIIQSTIDQPLTTWRDNTDGNGNGSKIQARGSATIDHFIDHTGEAKKVIFEDNPEYNLWVFDLKMNYRYTSVSHGESWGCVFNQCTFDDNLWDSIHPEGTIIANFYSVPNQNLQLNFQIIVDPDSDDRPGKFIGERVATQFREPFCKAAEEFTGLVIDRVTISFIDAKFSELFR